MSNPKQMVEVTFTNYSDAGDPYPNVIRTAEIRGGNLRTGVAAIVKELLTGYDTKNGVTIKIEVAKAPADEFANPER